MADVSLGFAEVHIGDGSTETRNRLQNVGRALTPLARPNGQQLLGVRYPWRFWALVLAALGLAVVWVCHYLLAKLPRTDAHSSVDCKGTDDRLFHNAEMLFVYFAWFAMSRISLLVPRIASHVAHVLFRARGFWSACITNLVLRDGPLYVLVVGSLLLGFHLVDGSICLRHRPNVYLVLIVHCACSCLLSGLCFALAYWHTKLLCEAAHSIFNHEDTGAPLGTLQRFQSVAFNPQHSAGDANGLCSPECTICLLAWATGDAIKVTPCGHAFHEECLGNWLQTARTCPICRCDLVLGAHIANLPAGDPPTTAPLRVVESSIAREPGVMLPVSRVLSTSDGEGATRGHSFGSCRAMEQETATLALCDARMVSMEISID